MSVDQPGPVAPQASVSAPRAGSGPKRPPRPAPPVEAEATSTTQADPEPATTPKPSSKTKNKNKSKPDTKPTPPSNGSPRDDATVQTVLTPDDPATSPPGFGGSPPVAPAVTAAPPATDKRGRAVRRARRVKRVVRRIDLWSVLKLSLVVYTCIYLATLGTLAVLWGVLYSSGSIDKLQSFLEDVGLENFTFYGNQMFRACAAIGAVGVMAGTVVTVLATALVNIISEMTGGIRLVVIEEDVEV